MFRLSSFTKKSQSTSMILYMGSSQMIANILRIIGGLLVAKLIMPDVLGLFNGIGLIISYLPILQFGVMNGLNRELPYYLGKGEKNEAYKLASVVQYWEIILAVLSGSSLLIISIYYLLNNNYVYCIGFFAYAIASFRLFFGVNYLQILFRTNSDFNKLSLITLIISIITFISIIFVWFWGYYGLCFRLIILSIIEVFLLWRYRPLKVKPSFNKKYFFKIIKVGMPIYIVGMVFSLWMTFQNTLVLKMGGIQEFGLFALALMVQSSLDILTNAVAQVLYPKMAFEYGKGSSPKNVIKIINKPVLIFSLILLPSIAIIWYALPPIVEYLLPQYKLGIGAAKYTLLLTIFSVLAVYNVTFNVLKRQKDYLFSILSGILVFFIILFVEYKIWGYSLEMFPIAMLFGKATQIILAYFFY